MIQRIWVRDLVAPTVPVFTFSPLLIAPAGQVTVAGGATDNVDLDAAEVYEIFGALGHAFRMVTAPIGVFGPAEFHTETSFTAPAFGFVSHMQVGVAGVATPATAFLARVRDFGRNYAHGGSAVPGLNAAIPAGDAIGTAAQFTNGALVCVLASCPTTTAPASIGATVQVTIPVTSTAGPPFSRVELYVGRDADDNGVIDTDGAGSALWNSAGPAGPPVLAGNLFTWTKTVTGAELLAAAGRVTPGQVTTPVFIRFVGFRPNGQAFTVANGAAACPLTPGADAACAITLANN
jgi:hypothetical protein